jgi:hypothetical protein
MAWCPELYGAKIRHCEKLSRSPSSDESDEAIQSLFFKELDCFARRSLALPMIVGSQ